METFLYSLWSAKLTLIFRWKVMYTITLYLKFLDIRGRFLFLFFFFTFFFFNLMESGCNWPSLPVGKCRLQSKRYFLGQKNKEIEYYYTTAPAWWKNVFPSETYTANDILWSVRNMVSHHKEERKETCCLFPHIFFTLR